MDSANVLGGVGGAVAINWRCKYICDSADTMSAEVGTQSWPAAPPLATRFESLAKRSCRVPLLELAIVENCCRVDIVVKELV
jgi:hypothetical protein